MTSDMLDAQRRPISIDDFHRMADAGIFDDDERVELIDGELIVPPQMGPRHAGAIRRVNVLLVARLADRASIGCQIPQPMRPISESFPDFVIAKPSADHYADQHPEIADVLWAIEIGDASRRYDRAKKFPLYARHAVAETWLLDLVDLRLVVGTQPSELGYARIVTLGPADSVTPEAFPDVSFAVSDLLGA